MTNFEDPPFLLGWGKEDGLTTIKGLKQLTAADYRTYLRVVQELRAAQYALWLLLMVDRNAEDLRLALHKKAPLTKSHDAHSDLGYFLFVEVNRRLLSFLASFRMYVDHTDRRAKKGGKKAMQRAWKDLCSYAYDNSFAYRFFSKLRNMAQHRDIPLTTLEHSGGLHGRGRERYGWAAAIDTDSLLELDPKGWGSVREELEAAPAKLQIEPLVRDVMHELRRNAKLLTSVEFPDLKKQAVTLIELLAPAFDQGMMPKVGWVTRDESQGTTNLKLDEYPVQMLQWLGLLKIGDK